MDSFLFTIEVLAILTWAYSGIIEAKRSGFDFVGILSVALVTAFGGGTIRDMLIFRSPIYWIEHWEFIFYIFVLAVISLLLLRFNKDYSSQKTLVVTDALGLGLFCATGVNIALKRDIPYLPAVCIGVITATFGGVLRDILCSKKPQLFQPTEPLYATCAVVGAWVYILLNWIGLSSVFPITACVLTTFILRIAAIRFQIKLPF